MTKHLFDLKDNRLTPTSAPACTLRLILGTQDLSVMVSNGAGVILAVQNWEYRTNQKPFNQVERELRSMLKAEPALLLPYGRKLTALFHPNITFVPRRLFQHSALPAYFKLILEPSEYRYAYEELPEFDAYLVCATEKAQTDLLAEFFPETRPEHLAVPLLRYIRGLASISEHTVFVNIRSKLAQIAVLERQNLLFFNTCAFTTPSDLLYFILLAYEQFKLKPAEVPLTLAGSVLKDSELFQILYRFIREIRLAVPPVQFQFPDDAEILPGHCYVDLLCLKNQ